MDYLQAMKALESVGTAQNRKVFARHGVQEPMFGVSAANLNKIKKEVTRLPGPGRRYAKYAHELAVELWESGNYDARLLATRLAEPDRMTSSQLDQWMRECDGYPIEGALVRASGVTEDVRTDEQGRFALPLTTEGAAKRRANNCTTPPSAPEPQ